METFFPSLFQRMCRINFSDLYIKAYLEIVVVIDDLLQHYLLKRM